MRIEKLTQRSTSQSKSFHFAFIDSLRGLAVLWVFFYHAQGEVFGWNEARFNGLFRQIDGFWDLILIPLRAGTLGVAIFFAVSGFCIHLSHQRLASKSWKVFFSRRFFRLYPAYLVILFVFVFAWPLYHFSWHSGVKLRELILHVLSLHNLDVNTKFAINPSLWSIAAEVQLYFVYPLLLRLCKKFSWPVVLSFLFAIEVLLLTIGGLTAEPKSPVLFFLLNSPLSAWFSWSFGAYIADLLISNRRSVFVDNLPIPLVAVLAIISLLFKPLAAVDFTIVALLTSLMIYRAVVSGSQSSSGPLLRQCSRLLVWFGLISYSLYLIHQPFLELVNHYIKKHHFLAASPLSAVFALMLLLAPLALLASLVYRWVELPGIVIGRHVESWFEPVAHPERPN